MLRFLLRRLALIIPTFIGITIVSFGFIRMLPADPIEAMSGERGITPERHAFLLHQFGLDRPLWQQYLEYVWGLLRGDFGNSMASSHPILADFRVLFPATIELSVTAMLIAIVIGLPLGVVAAVRRGKLVDQLAMGGALIGYSMPIFWWGLLLIIVFSGMLHWTPVAGRIGADYFIKPVTGFMLIDSWRSGQAGAFRSALSHLVLPAIVLGTIPLAVNRAPDAIGDARGARRGLRAHGAR